MRKYPLLYALVKGIGGGKISGIFGGRGRDGSKGEKQWVRSKKGKHFFTTEKNTRSFSARKTTGREKKHIAYTDPKASYRDHPRMCISSCTEGENSLILTEPDEEEKRSLINDILDSILFDPDDFE